MLFRPLVLKDQCPAAALLILILHRTHGTRHILLVAHHMGVNPKWDVVPDHSLCKRPDSGTEAYQTSSASTEKGGAVCLQLLAGVLPGRLQGPVSTAESWLFTRRLGWLAGGRWILCHSNCLFLCLSESKRGEQGSQLWGTQSSLVLCILN